MASAFTVLVLCTGNSARSIVGEVLLNDLGRGAVRGLSAGSKPVGAVNPAAVDILRSKGHSVDGLASKSWDEIAAGDTDIGLVITVCDSAAGEACPVLPGAPNRVHWGVPDPAGVPVDRRGAAFAAVYAAFHPAFDALIAAITNGLRGKALVERATELAPKGVKF